MKKWIAVLLTLTCAMSMVSCAFVKDLFNKDGGSKADGYLGEITEKQAEATDGVFWKYADKNVLNELDAAFDEKKAIANGFWDVPKTTGTTYYVSSVNGNDSASGTSASTAWKTCKNLTSGKLKSGDTVLFACGSEFVEKISLVSGVTYASYGTGDKPVFSASLDASKKSDWSAVSGKSNLYQYTGKLHSSDNIGTIVFNGGEAWGIKIQQHTDAQKSMELVDLTNGLQHFDKIPSYDLQTGKDLGKFNLCFYQDATTVYLYCEGGNPAEVFKSVEMTKDAMLFSGSDVKNVTIANINFKNATFGIRTTDCKNLVVRNCGFEFIGGQVQAGYGTSWRNYETRLGNAIENWNSCDGMVVENCYFNQIYDTAMTTQSNTDGTDMINISYCNNVIENAVYAIELWSSGAKEASCDFKNVKIDGNVCRDLGYGLPSQRPDKVTGFLSAKGSYYVYNNATLTNNIINGSIDWLYRTNNIATNENPNGYVLDDNIYVNTLGNEIGMLSSAFPKFSESIKEFEYDYDTIKKLYDCGVDVHSKFYYTNESDDEGSEQDQTEGLNSALASASDYIYTMEGGEALPFRLLFPSDYEEGKSYRLFVYLNYEYANGTDNLKNVQMSNDLIAQVFADGDYIVLVPQCPTDTWTGLDVENGNYSTANVAESAVMKSVYGLVHDVAMKYNTSGSYAAGVSAGAYAVADLSARHNDLFKAVVLIAGAGDPSASIGNTKVMICHGEGDEKVPVADARKLAEAWNAEYQEYPRELHDCWTIVFVREDVVGWLNEN